MLKYNLPEGLGGHPDGSLGPELLLLGALDQVRAHLLQRLDVLGGEGDADPVDRRLVAARGLGILVSRLQWHKNITHLNMSF